MNTVGFGNLFGAVITFSYFTFFDAAEHTDTVTSTGEHVAFFMLAYPLLAAIGIWLSGRWRVPYLEESPDLSDPSVRRRALALPFILAGVTALGWCLAGVVWGIVWPALRGTLDWSRAMRVMFGITIVGGSITTMFTFFSVERSWRPILPGYFPRGDLSAVTRVPRLGVRARLVLVFLFVGLLPTFLMARRAYRVAKAIAAAPPAEVPPLLDNMVVVIGFLVAIGALTAVGLAFVVSRSVSEPLRDVERAMERVGRGEFDTRAPVVSNDELGAVAEGFNRMVTGLQERERIRETFGKYVSPEVRDEILASGTRLEGQVREVTILFSDLRDFTPWVESNPPADVVRDINAYFTLMEGAIRAHGGLVVQFIGDEIEAVFGAPVADPHHADHAVKAAIDMRRRLEAWNESRRANGSVILRHGIGIHTGEVLAASIGSPERLSYALVGDPVNLASRIQGLTKEVGGDLLVSGETARRLKEPVSLEALPAVRVKGRLSEVEVYKCLST
jgi:adenylate cyclase